MTIQKEEKKIIFIQWVLFEFSIENIYHVLVTFKPIQKINILIGTNSKIITHIKMSNI